MPVLKTTLKVLNNKLMAIKVEDSKSGTVPKLSPVKKFPAVESNKGDFNKILQLIFSLGELSQWAFYCWTPTAMFAKLKVLLISLNKVHNVLNCQCPNYR